MANSGSAIGAARSKISVKKKRKKPGAAYTFLDLFSGCGGFTLGMQRAGFKCLAAVDLDENAISTLKANVAGVNHILKRDLSTYSPEELAEEIGTKTVDVIVGGPPCQGFSTARQADGANHGKRLKDDPRRHLYKDFLRFVDYFQPKVFVMENVLGMRTAAGGVYFAAVQREARRIGNGRGFHGYRVHGQIEDAWVLGVPQKRKRQLIVGVRSDVPGYFSPRIESAPRATPRITLGPVIADLPVLRAGSGSEESQYDLDRRKASLTKYKNLASRYLQEVLEIQKAPLLLNHRSRPHNERDLRDFDRLREGESSQIAMRRGVEFEFPYDKENFKDRYTRQSRSKACSTIVAHLGKDGLMFIHPTQCRSITPREAARIQSFPDWFRFPAARSHSFRLIGNAVPPLVSEAIGRAVSKFLSEKQKATKKKQRSTRTLLTHTSSELLQTAIALEGAALRRLPNEEFLRIWKSIFFRLPDLHPCNAIDHGEESETHLGYPGSALRVELAKRYSRTGWPVVLTAFGAEAWRRYSGGKLSEDQMFLKS